MKDRNQYLNQLINFKDKPLIKVITGIRRCGKSTLLVLFEQYLHKKGITTDNIIRMNFESLEYDEITDYKALYAYLKNKLKNTKETCYLLFDEIQQVREWEKAINSLFVDRDVDIYITGSNAYLLSSELSTLLSGRYIEIKMQPLTFKEYCDFIDGKETGKALQEKFAGYIQYGGFPTIVELLDRPETIPSFLTGIYNTVLVKDVIQRNEVRDAVLMENLIKYLASNIGNIVSTKKISDYLTSNGRKTTSDTIDNYLAMLESAYIIYRANRYDLKGKLYLKTLEKYYIVDTGIRNQLTGMRNSDYGHILENVIFFELLNRGYEVCIGKVGTLEIDFLATKPEKKVYIQVCATIMDEETRKRELRPLQAIQDQYEKIILTMDTPIYTDFEGIKNINIIDFLRGEEY